MARAPAKRHNYETRRSGRHRPLTERSSVLARRAGFARLFVSFAANLASQAVVVHNESVKITLETINQMQADGVIEEYAIGGAVGATFYLEPAATLDLDIFVILPATSERVLVNLAPIYFDRTGWGEDAGYVCGTSSSNCAADWSGKRLYPPHSVS
jgi:hypothetical protein